jgi:putative transposase
MARPQRIEYEGAVYHVTVRGNERRVLFLDDHDRNRFLRLLAESVEVFEVRLYLFCLMSNHIHLVLETPRGNLSRFMHRLETAYTVYFNHRRERRGHLMQGRYKAFLIERDAYLLRLSRYVHLNPVFTKPLRDRPTRERIALLRRYPWSSYRSYIGRDARLAFVDYGPLLEAVGSGHSGVYRRFVEAGISQIDAAFIEEARASKLCLGSEAFHLTVRTRYEGLLKGRSRTEDVAFRRTVAHVPADRILQVVSKSLGVDRASLLHRQRDSLDRAVTARMLCEYGGLTQRQAADVLGLRSGAAVSAQLQKLPGRLNEDPHLRKQVARIAAQLKAARP